MAVPSLSAVWFPRWAETLERLGLPALRRQRHRQAIIRFLGFCRETRQRATVTSARAFMATVVAQGQVGESDLATWREALNWFFRERRKSTADDRQPAEGRRPGANARTDVPPPAATDLGATAWERRLIEALRSGKHSAES